MKYKDVYMFVCVFATRKEFTPSPKKLIKAEI